MSGRATPQLREGGECAGESGVATLHGAYVSPRRDVGRVPESLLEVGEAHSRRGRKGGALCRKS